MKKKKYTKTKISSIVIDQEQALLAVCKSGAGTQGYMFNPSYCSFGGLGVDLPCNTKIRGVGLTGTILTSEEKYNMPS